MNCRGIVSLLQLRHVFCTRSSEIHTNNVFFAAKKTTSAAGGVMGLGKGKKGKMGKLGTMEKKELPVETDPQRLVSHVCGSNIYTTGEDVKVGAEAEYPAWLWALPLGAAPALESLSPDTKRYWLRARAAAIRRNNRLRQLRAF